MEIAQNYAKRVKVIIVKTQEIVAELHQLSHNFMMKMMMVDLKLA